MSFGSLGNNIWGYRWLNSSLTSNYRSKKDQYEIHKVTTHAPVDLSLVALMVPGQSY